MIDIAYANNVHRRYTLFRSRFTNKNIAKIKLNYFSIKIFEGTASVSCAAVSRRLVRYTLNRRIDQVSSMRMHNRIVHPPTFTVFKFLIAFRPSALDAFFRPVNRLYAKTYRNLRKPSFLLSPTPSNLQVLKQIQSNFICIAWFCQLFLVREKFNLGCSANRCRDLTVSNKNHYLAYHPSRIRLKNHPQFITSVPKR